MTAQARLLSKVRSPIKRSIHLIYKRSASPIEDYCKKDLMTLPRRRYNVLCTALILAIFRKFVGELSYIAEFEYLCVIPVSSVVDPLP